MTGGAGGVRLPRWVRVALQVAFLALILFFLIRVIVRSWDQIAAFPWQFQPGLLIASVAVQVAAGLFWATVWRRMAVQAGSAIGWAAGVRVYLLSNLAKYVPGSIWGYLSRAYLGRESGLTVARVGVSTVWEVGITVVASLLLTALTIPFYPIRLPDHVLLLAVAAALICLTALLPPVFNRWLPRLPRLARQQKVHFRWRDFGLYLAAAFITHVLVGTGFFLFAASLVELELAAWPGFVGAWSFSATAGLVMLLAPYGLGVKEGLLTLLLQAFMPAGAAALVALASRLWTVAVELLEAAVALFLPIHPSNTPYG